MVVIQWVGGLMGFYQDDARGRWIDGATVSYDNWQPGINAPCPGAYQPMGKCWGLTSCVCVCVASCGVTNHVELVLVLVGVCVLQLSST